MSHIDLTNRPEFGAYLNMAQHNCFIALRHLATILGYNEEKISSLGIEDFNQGNIANAFIIRDEFLPTEPEIRDRMQQQLLSLFPMLDPFSKRENDKLIKEEVSKRVQPGSKKKPILKTSELNYKPLKDLCSILRKVFEVLTFYRDMSSHVIFNDSRSTDSEYSQTEKAVADMLHFTQTVATRIVKVRFNLSNEIDFFINNRNDERYLNSYIDKKRMKIVNTSFSHSVYQDEGVYESGLPVMRSLSENGVVYLVCMFLERKYAKMFIDHLKSSFFDICENGSGFSQERIIKNKSLLFEIYTVYRMHPPQKKLNSMRLDMANAMDMLNELKKCPADLFDVLEKEKQDEFAVTADTGERVLLRRNTDRFAPLAMRWIDENNLLGNLRFHVRYGKYHYVFCDEKHCADGIKRVRTIVKDLNGFGKISEVEARRHGETGIGNFGKQPWNGAAMIRQFENFVPDEPGMKPYITDYQTQYITENNVVGLHCGDLMPEIGADNKIANSRPDYWLSLYDLPGLVFYSLLTHQTACASYPTAEKIITAYGDKFKRLFTDLREGSLLSIKCVNPNKPLASEYKAFCDRYGLDWKEIPQKIKDIATGRKRGNFLQSANALMNSEDEDTSRRLDRHERIIDTLTSNGGADNKMGNKRQEKLRPGEMAEFLAHDIVRYMPFEKPSDKPTGLNYQILQSALATFAHKEALEGIKRILTSLNLMTHPFIGKVFEKPIANVVDLYKEYLYAKSDYLYDLMDDNSCFDEQFLRSVPFINAERMKWAEMNRENQKLLAEHYLSLPVSLPTALFEDAIRKVLLDKHGDILRTELAKPVCNTSYMIQQYLRRVRKDNIQKFYCYQRPGYRIFNLLGWAPSYKEMHNHLDALARRSGANQWSLMDNIAKVRWKKSNQGKDFIVEFVKKCHRTYIDYKNTERAIRRYSTEDILLYLMAWDVLLDKNISLEGGKLSDVSPTNEHSILSTNIPEISIQFTISWREKDLERSSNKHPVYNNYSKDITIVYENIKIKDWSKLLKLLYDWRINSGGKSLLVQIANANKQTGNQILYKFADVHAELASFDEKRVAVFREVLDFENEMINIVKQSSTYTDDVYLKETDGMLRKIDFGDEMKIFVQHAFGKKMSRKSKQGYFTSQIRNSLCHNQYPALAEMNVYINGQAQMPEIVEAMRKCFKKAAAEILNGELEE